MSGPPRGRAAAAAAADAAAVTRPERGPVPRDDGSRDEIVSDRNGRWPADSVSEWAVDVAEERLDERARDDRGEGRDGSAAERAVALSAPSDAPMARVTTAEAPGWTSAAAMEAASPPPLMLSWRSVATLPPLSEQGNSAASTSGTAPTDRMDSASATDSAWICSAMGTNRPSSRITTRSSPREPFTVSRRMKKSSADMTPSPNCSSTIIFTVPA